MTTTTKSPDEIQIGDVIEYEGEPFTLEYLTVTKTPETDTNGTDSWYVLVGEDGGGNAGELYIDPDDTLEIVQ